ncbi:MAG TPA: DUF6600 domain-containing protein, partial [Xanthomonadales bacterium]|nr:DUF6600 domain-containing protein [Xanthomonadales bacterium]
MTPFVRSMLQLAALAGLAIFATTASAQRYVDPPSRVARLAHAEGDVSFSPAGTDDWRRAQRNRPHWRGDRLWTGRRSRAELQVGGAALRLDARTGVEILELDDRYAQFELSEGTVNLSVRHLDRGDAYEIATPMFALVVDRRATVRVDVEPSSGRTEVVVWDGTAVAYGQRGQFALHEGDAVRFYDPSLRDYDFFDPRPDGFDAYADARDARLERSGSLRYVPAGLIGYADLDEYGSWRSVSEYGSVWFPSRVDRSWRPYRDGHWIYQEPWGWTWIDEAEWGFATSHYGRWVQVDRRWGWIPSPRRERPVYAPALVAFLGFDSGARGPIGWFPLGPREVYYPTYRTSRDYFGRVNFGNTAFQDRSWLAGAYSAYERGRVAPNLSYRYNRGEYVTAVPREVFIGARPVSQAAVPYRGDTGAIAQLDRIRALEPSRQSRYSAALPAATAPAGEVFRREVFARHAPTPAAPVQGEPAQRGRDRGGDARGNVRMIRGEGLPVIPRDAPRSEESGQARDRGIDRGADRASERALERRADPGERGEGRAADRALERRADPGGRGDPRDAREAQRAQEEGRAAEQRDRDARAGAEAAAQRDAVRAAREAEQAQREAEQAQREAQRSEQERQRQAEQAQRAQQREAEQAQREQQRAAEQAQREQEAAARRDEVRRAREQGEAEREVQNARARRELERERQEQQRAAEQAQREAERAQQA